MSLIVADGKGNEKINEIDIHDVGLYHGRLRRFVVSAIKIRKIAFALDCDIYHFHDPELIFVGLSLKRKRKKVIFDMHENIPVDISEKEYIPKWIRKAVVAVYTLIERYSVRRFDAVITTIEGTTSRVRRYNPNVEFITNYPIVEDDHYHREESPSATLCFAGGVIPNWQHKEIIQAVNPIPDIQYFLAGPDAVNYIQELRQLDGWHKVVYLGDIPFEEVKELYRKSYIGVAIYIYCNRLDGHNGTLSVTKLFEFMQWEMPVICTDFVLWKRIIDEEKCGICVNPYDIDAIRNAIQYLIDNPDEARQMGINGRKAVLTKYNWKTQEEKLLSLYERIK